MNQTPKSLFPYYEKVDLSYREHWREYIFSNEERIRIDSPQYIIVSDNGHRVMNGRDTCYYIPYGWIGLIWKSKEGYGFYCEGDDEIDPVEKTNSSEKIVDHYNNILIGKHTSPEDELEKNDSIKTCISAFLRFFKDQLNNANRNNSTIEFQTLIRIKEKFLDLFQLWIGEQDESEKELEQSSTESTE